MGSWEGFSLNRPAKGVICVLLAECFCEVKADVKPSHIYIYLRSVEKYEIQVNACHCNISFKTYFVDVSYFNGSTWRISFCKKKKEIKSWGHILKYLKESRYSKLFNAIWYEMLSNVIGHTLQSIYMTSELLCSKHSRTECQKKIATEPTSVMSC